MASHDDGDKCIDHIGLKLMPARADDEIERFFLRPRSLVDTLAGECIEYVGHGDNAAASRNVGATECAWITRAVPTLVMVQRNDCAQLNERIRAARKDLRAHCCVGLHDLELFGGERPRLEQDGIRNRHLADVVQPRGHAQLLAPLAVFVEFVGDFGREVAHSNGVLAGVGVAEFGQHGETLECLELVFLEFVRAATNQCFKLGGAQPQDLGLLANVLGVVRDLQRFDSQIGALIEQILVQIETRLLVVEGLFEAAELSIHLGEQLASVELYCRQG